MSKSKRTNSRQQTLHRLIESIRDYRTFYENRVKNLKLLKKKRGD